MCDHVPAGGASHACSFSRHVTKATTPRTYLSHATSVYVSSARASSYIGMWRVGCGCYRSALGGWDGGWDGACCRYSLRTLPVIWVPTKQSNNAGPLRWTAAVCDGCSCVRCAVLSFFFCPVAVPLKTGKTCRFHGVNVQFTAVGATRQRKAHETKSTITWVAKPLRRVTRPLNKRDMET